MRLICTLLFIGVNTLWGQTSLRQKTDSIAQLLQQYYNDQDFTALYSLGGEKFQQSLSEDKFVQTSQGMFAQFGKLNTTTLESVTSEVAKYKASFSNMQLSLYLSVDVKDKLVTYLLRPYETDLPVSDKPVLTNNPLRTAFDKKVDSLVKPFISRANTVGLVVGVLKDGKTYIYGYGETEKGSKQIPDGNTLFEIGSISKTFTATLLAYLVQQGKLQLTDPVNKYLPDSVAHLVYNEKPITLQSLSNHSSGLPRLPIDLFAGADRANPYRHYDDKRLFRNLAHFKPYREPGGQYEYSNLAVGLLGVIMERVTGKPYEQLLKEIVCKPLHMTSTGITIGPADSVRFSQAYNNSAEPVPSWEFQSLAGAGAIRSCVNDMLLYLRAQVDSGVTTLQKAIALTHRQTFEHGQTKVALGWHFMEQEGVQYLGHNGQTGGYCSVALINPATGNAVVILTNASVEPSRVAMDILQMVE